MCVAVTILLPPISRNNVSLEILRSGSRCKFSNYIGSFSSMCISYNLHNLTISRPRVGFSAQPVHNMRMHIKDGLHNPTIYSILPLISIAVSPSFAGINLPSLHYATYDSRGIYTICKVSLSFLRYLWLTTAALCQLNLVTPKRSFWNRKEMSSTRKDNMKQRNANSPTQSKKTQQALYTTPTVQQVVWLWKSKAYHTLRRGVLTYLSDIWMRQPTPSK